MNDKDAKALIEEVRAVKMLMVLQLMGQGIKQKQIAAMLGVSEATISRMIPKSGPKTTIKASTQLVTGDEVGQE